MKPLTTLLTATLLSAASLTACSGTENGMSIQQQTEQRFKLNPNPKQAYRIKIKINDAPGSFQYVSDMDVDYVARNCSYVINYVEGVSTEPKKAVQTPIRQIGEYEYETVIYLDAVQDEDYFGQGVCRWKPEGFGFGLKATGKPEETDFGFGDILGKLMDKQTLTRYYWKGGYPQYKNDDGSLYESDHMVDFGNIFENLNNYTADQRQNLFSITLTIEEL